MNYLNQTLIELRELIKTGTAEEAVFCSKIINAVKDKKVNLLIKKLYEDDQLDEYVDRYWQHKSKTINDLKKTLEEGIETLPSIDIVLMVGILNEIKTGNLIIDWPAPDVEVETTKRKRRVRAKDEETYSVSEITPAKKQTKLQIKTNYQSNWLQWIEDFLHIQTTPWPDDLIPDNWKPKDGFPLTSYQIEIIEALRVHKKVAVRSSHDVGKTFIAAVCTLVITYVMKSMTLTTAPTFRQVKRLLWAEIHKLYNRAETINKKRGMCLGGQLNKTSLELDSGKWFAEGFSTDKDYNFQGFHESTIFLVVDEAGQVTRDIYDAFDSILTNENIYVLLIGNPIDPHNEFRNFFKEGSGFHQMKIDSWMTPNVKHGKNMFPFLVSYDWPDMMLRKWKDPDHPFYRGKVRAEFPIEGEDQLITWELIQAALDRELPDDSPIESIGLDVARKGMDSTVYGYKRMNGKFRIYRVTDQERETETAGRVKLDLKNQGPIQVEEFTVVNVDDIGVGGGVSDILFEEDYNLNEIVVSETPEQWQDEDGMFLNKRSWYYWQLRQAFVGGAVDIDDEELAEELHAMQKEYTSNGKIKITSKDIIRSKIGRSPDKADCMMLAWSETEGNNTRDLVRTL